MDSLTLADILKFFFQYLFSPTMIAGLIIYIWNVQREEIKDMKKRIEKNETDIQEFHFNYLDRFKDINEKNTEQHSSIKTENANEHTELKVMLAKVCQKLGIE